MQPLHVGSIISRSFSVLLANAFTFVLISGLALVPIFIFGGILYVSGDQSGLFAIPIFIGTLLMLVMVPAALSYGAVRHLVGQRASIGECIATGLQVVFPVLLAGILNALAIMGGTIFFLIPGIIVWLVLSVFVPVVVFERPGVFASLSRSAELTRGHRLTIFGIYVVLALIFLGLTLVAGITESILGPVGVLFGFVTSVLLSALWPVATAVIYHDLRVIEAGVGAGESAHLFR